MQIIVNISDREITFTNILFKTRNSYSFADFDGYIETIEKSRQGSFKAIYLVKNKKLKKVIRGFYYSNIDEIQNALNDIPNLGFKKFGWLSSVILYITRDVFK